MKNLVLSIKTSRKSYPLVWSINADAIYAATDPDLDTEHPIYIENRYEAIGWQAEKLPEQWQNFLQQITDLKLKEALENGVFGWFPDVFYTLGTVVWYEGVLYIQTSTTDSINQIPNESGNWDTISDISYDGYTNSLQVLVDNDNKHETSLGSSNPHQDDITTIGGYTQEEIDNMFSSDVEGTMANHIANHNNPHNVTCEQVSILPKSGGTFTGVVNFAGGISIGSGMINIIK
ncbi:hypothetical protein I6H07_06060 [Hafnia alvei]|nr:hypothetical protein [Hafnia alvei]MBI0275398.1 hypothetical protein [Hafnia alvei]PNK98607.1 hypothetical protein CEQ28_013935 [Hafnia alvei]